MPSRRPPASVRARTYSIPGPGVIASRTAAARNRVISKVDGGQDLRWPLVEGPADRQQALDTRQIRAALDAADLADAQARSSGEVFQRPVALDAEHFDSVAEV